MPVTAITQRLGRILFRLRGARASSRWVCLQPVPLGWLIPALLGVRSQVLPFRIWCILDHCKGKGTMTTNLNAGNKAVHRAGMRRTAASRVEHCTHVYKPWVCICLRVWAGRFGNPTKLSATTMTTKGSNYFQHPILGCTPTKGFELLLVPPPRSEWNSQTTPPPLLALNTHRCKRLKRQFLEAGWGGGAVCLVGRRANSMSRAFERGLRQAALYGCEAALQPGPAVLMLQDVLQKRGHEVPFRIWHHLTNQCWWLPECPR